MTYIGARRDGAWYVIDKETGEVVDAAGAGPNGAQNAVNAAARWNLRASESVMALRTWRRDHHLSQAALAELLGVQRLAVVRWETGVRGIPPFLHLALKQLHTELADGALEPVTEGALANHPDFDFVQRMR